MARKNVRRRDLVYPELSYQVIGILFDVYNTLGYGQAERSYQKAIAAALKLSGLSFQEQIYSPLVYRDTKIGSNFFDFLIDERLILEIKKGDRFSKSHIDQLYRYLRHARLKLGILAYFAPRNLHFKRIVNL